MQKEQEPTIQDLENQVAARKEQTASSGTPSPDEPLVSWSASEFIAHHKAPSWYISFGVAAALLVAVVYLITRDLVSVAVIAIVGISFGVLATRKPEVREYTITRQGISVSDKLYNFELFKSFAIHDEGAVSSIYLLPVKRFMPELRIYYPPDQEDDIVAALADYLPMEDSEPSAVDNLMRKIRF